MSGHLLQSAGLLACVPLLMSSHHLAQTGRSRWAQSTGLIAGLALMVWVAAVLRPTGSWTAVVPLAGLIPAVLAASWAPGAIASLGVAWLLFVTGGAALDGHGWTDEYLLIAYAGWFVVLGAIGVLFLADLLPPTSLTRTLGLGSWVLGVAYLLGAPAPDDWAAGAAFWGWTSGAALCAIALHRFAAAPSVIWALALLAGSLVLAATVGPVVVVGTLIADLTVVSLLYRRHLNRSDLP